MVYAVITGDIVQSTSEKDGKRSNFHVIDEILTGAFEVMTEKKWLNAEDYVSFRGDSFQCLLPPDKGLLGALFIKAALRGGIASDPRTPLPWSGSCRMVVGIGEVTYRAEQVSKSNGPAFQRSGRTLDAMPRDHYIDIVTPWEEVNEEFELTARFLDIIVERLWTKISARTAWVHFLEEWTQQQLAELFGISQPAMHQRIQGAEIAVLDHTIERFQSTIKKHYI